MIPMQARFDSSLAVDKSRIVCAGPASVNDSLVIQMRFRSSFSLLSRGPLRTQDSKNTQLHQFCPYAGAYNPRDHRRAADSSTYVGP